jgi:HemY protein
MLERDETAFLGLRGLLMQAQRDGDETAALAYAREAYKLRPKTPWVLTTLFDLQVRHGDWTNARVTLDEAIRQHAIPPEEGRSKRVVVLLGASGEAGEAGSPKDALGHAKKAHDQAPSFLPATLRMAGLLIGQGKHRQAAKLIQDAWSRAPHPDLARLYLSMYEDEEPLRRIHRLEKLVSFNPEHPESRIALAEAALVAELWGKARGHLEPELADTPPARVCRLMADIEEAENGDLEAARQWLIKAGTAEPDPSWKCTDCGAAWRHWSPVCGKCEALGTLDWGAPERAREDALGAAIITPDPVLTHRPSPGGTAGGSGGAEVLDSEDALPGDELDPDDDPPVGDAPFFPKTGETKPSGRLPKFLGRRV